MLYLFLWFYGPRSDLDLCCGRSNKPGKEERNKGGEGEETEAQTFRPTLQQWSDLPRLGFERVKCVMLIIVLHFS